MKELFDRFPKISLLSAKNVILLDTCFLISAMEHPEHFQELLSLRGKAMTSFNVEEIIKVMHHKKKHALHKFLREVQDFTIIDIPVHPGEWEKEKSFVESIDPKIMQHCRDTSDAVLLAAAVKTHSVVLTKDAHDIFNAYLENFMNREGVKVYKELKDVLEWVSPRQK